MSTAKPHILICIDWFEPGYKAGGPIRSVVNLIAALHNQYEFSILTTDRDLGDAAPYPGIESDEWIQREHYAIWYASPENRGYRNIRGVLDRISYDVLYCQSMFSLRFSLFPVWASRAVRPEARIVWAPRGMLHAGALGFKSRKKKWFLRFLNWAGLPKEVRFQATDAQEIADIRQHFGEVDIVQVANLPRMKLPEPQTIEKLPGKIRLVFLSRLTEKKGLHWILEALADRSEEIEFDIYGVQDEPEYWKHCEELIAELPEQIQVNYHGPIAPAESVRVLQAAHLFVMPTKGENFGHAIYESLAAGRPVLISDQTPWRDLEANKAGLDLSLGEGLVARLGAMIGEFAGMEQREWEEWCAGAREMAAGYLAGLDAEGSYGRLFESSATD